MNKGLLSFRARRPNLYGLETHLAAMYREVRDFDPAAVVIDPMSAFGVPGVILVWLAANVSASIDRSRA